MPIDYSALSLENLRRYGTDVGEWAPELLANLYQERTHFVFELLQNAEDALRKRVGDGPRSVQFDLRRDGLMVSHAGKPFDEADVRGICGINKSTKKDEITAIGRFGIGFKSVYAVTDRPEIRSAGQRFAIESYVHPVELEPTASADERTSFWFPFKDGDDDAFEEIGEGLRRLDARTLLFLHHVDEVDWQIEGGAKGTYCREAQRLASGPRKVALIGSTEPDGTLREEAWLVFSRTVESKGVPVGAVEIAYALDANTPGSEIRIQRAADSRLSAFFPTSVQTHLGVLLQGPYRTTPARDNVPPKNDWNQHLVRETASLLVESLETLKTLEGLSLEVLSGLPLDEDEFGEASMFRPLYNEVAETLRTRELLPTNGSLRVPSKRAALAREDLRKLVDAAQLRAIQSSQEALEWLDDELMLERNLTVRNYLASEHGVREITTQVLLGRMSKEFLEAQSDEWIRRLYAFLLGQTYLMKTAAVANKPWVRLEDGTHVVAFSGDRPNAFLPSGAASGFPTVRPGVCEEGEPREFLENSLRLSTPDPVDDVIANVLPLYEEEQAPDRDLERYREHLRAIEAAYSTQLRNQREKLVAALKKARWVPSTDDGGSKAWRTPYQCYLPTERLKSLFQGVPGINFVDDSVPGMQGETMRNILGACGSERHLDTVRPREGLSDAERSELRQRGGEPGCTSGQHEDDWTLHGLGGILERISGLPYDEASGRASLLWDELAEVVRDKREGVVKATYSWFYFKARQIDYPAAFVRTLQKAAWIPTPSGRLATPDEAVFEHIEPAWPSNAVLQSALRFRPSEVDQLAKALGLEPNMLSLLKKSGISSEAELKKRLGLAEEVAEPSDEAEIDLDQSGEHEPHVEPRTPAGPGFNGASGVNGQASPRTAGQSPSSGVPGSTKPQTKHAGKREFVSYLATHPIDEEGEDLSDSETQEEKMRVEALAIDRIIALDPGLQRTKAGNAGFDLFGTDGDGTPNRWIEVKAMVGSLASHPVGMSKRQFETAQEKKTRFWLYIVEKATSEEPRILKIQDPAGNARTFTFDQGWADIAMVSQVNVETGEVKA